MKNNESFYKVFNSIESGYVYDVFVDLLSIPVDLRKKFFTDREKIPEKRSSMKTNSIIVERCLKSLEKNPAELIDLFNEFVHYVKDSPVGIIINVTNNLSVEEKIEVNNILPYYNTSIRWFAEDGANLNLAESQRFVKTATNKVLVEDQNLLPYWYGVLNWYRTIWTHAEDKIRSIYILYGNNNLAQPGIDQTVRYSFLLSLRMLTEVGYLTPSEKINIYFDRGEAISSIFHDGLLSDQVGNIRPLSKTDNPCYMKMKLEKDFKQRIVEIAISNQPSPDNESKSASLLMRNISAEFSTPKFNKSVLRDELISVDIQSTTKGAITIPYHAFRLCRYLRRFTYSKLLKLTSIGAGAFSSTQLSNIKIKSGTELCSSAFMESNLKYIKIQPQVTTQKSRPTIHDLISYPNGDCPIIEEIIVNDYISYYRNIVDRAKNGVTLGKGHNGVSGFVDTVVLNIVDSKNHWTEESFMNTSIRSVIIRDIDVLSLSNPDSRKIRGVFFKCKIWSLEFSEDVLIKLKNLDLEKFMERLVDQCDIHDVIWPFDSMIPKKPFVLGSLYSGDLKELKDQYSARIAKVRRPYESICNYIENYIKGGDKHKLEDSIDNYIESNKSKLEDSNNKHTESGYLINDDVTLVTVPSTPWSLVDPVVVTQAVS